VEAQVLYRLGDVRAERQVDRHSAGRVDLDARQDSLSDGDHFVSVLTQGRGGGRLRLGRQLAENLFTNLLPDRFALCLADPRLLDTPRQDEAHDRDAYHKSWCSKAKRLHFYRLSSGCTERVTA